MTTTQTISRDDVVAFIEQIESDIEQGWEAQVFELKLAKHVLSAMDSEPVAYRDRKECNGIRFADGFDYGKLVDGAPLYAAPPAPVAVPDGYALVPLKPTKDMLTAAEDERGADWQYAVDIWDSMCRAAMLNQSTCATGLAPGVMYDPRPATAGSSMQAEPVTAANTLPPHIYRELVNQLRDTAVKYQGCQQLREQISATLSTVITPGVTKQQNSQQNIPENIPGDLIDAVNRLLDSDGSRGCYSAIECYDAHEEIERLLAAAPAAPEQEV